MKNLICRFCKSFIEIPIDMNYIHYDYTKDSYYFWCPECQMPEKIYITYRSYQKAKLQNRMQLTYN